MNWIIGMHLWFWTFFIHKPSSQNLNFTCNVWIDNTKMSTLLSNDDWVIWFELATFTFAAFAVAFAVAVAVAVTVLGSKQGIRYGDGQVYILFQRTCCGNPGSRCVCSCVCSCVCVCVCVCVWIWNHLIWIDLDLDLKSLLWIDLDLK